MAQTLAQLAVEKCLRIKSDDAVTLFFNPYLTELAEDISIECFKKGADVILVLWTDRFHEGFLTHLSEESLRQPSVWCRELTRNSTAQFWLGGVYDPAVFRKIPPEKLAASRVGESTSHFPLAKERKVRSLGFGIGAVTKPRAKAYDFNFAQWQKMMNAATRVDPETIAEEGRDVVAKLQNADTVSVTAPNGTDLKFSVKDRRPRLNDGIVDEHDVEEGVLEASIPAGSVDIAVREDSSNGRVAFDVPMPWVGRSIRKLVWTFQNGKVTEFDGDRNARLLRKHWESSAGDKDRIASLSIGLNPKAKLGFTVNTLVQGAVSIGVGANEDIGGANKPGFSCVGTLGNATLKIDGTTVIESGKLQR